MPVDTASILRLLAHELRSPAGVAHGYLTLALEGRLAGTDERAALGHARDALGRITALSREASDAAGWLERMAASPPGAAPPVAIRPLLDEAIAGLGAERVDVDPVPETLAVPSHDRAALAGALTTLLAATAREAPGARLALGHRLVGEPATHVDVGLAAPNLLSLVLAGPDDADASEVTIERGGLGLSLVVAILILTSHGAATWAARRERATLGLRLPVHTGSR